MNQLPTPVTPTATAAVAPGVGSERVFYRDIEEFNKALDAASESIRKAGRPDVLGLTIWVGLLIIQGVLYGLDWFLDIDLRTTLIPGIDLVKPLWALIIGMIISHHVWTRNRHARIIKSRLCFQCGASQLGTVVDDAGNGTCAARDRAFNLGEYRRPHENRGEHFHGYIDRKHFDKAVYSAAEQIKKMRISGYESDLMGWCWLALGVSFGAMIVLDWDLVDWLPGDLPYHSIWFVALLLWGWWYTARVKGILPTIVAERLCMNCGYSLVRTGTDADGLGRCPECGTIFALGQYEAPPEDTD